ncbi:UNVERIFIED_ORG: hypothetical protein ABID33_004517 [Xanthobacter viscosus]
MPRQSILILIVAHLSPRLSRYTQEVQRHALAHWMTVWQRPCPRATVGSSWRRPRRWPGLQNAERTVARCPALCRQSRAWSASRATSAFAGPARCTASARMRPLRHSVGHTKPFASIISSVPSGPSRRETVCLHRALPRPGRLHAALPKPVHCFRMVSKHLKAPINGRLSVPWRPCRLRGAGSRFNFTDSVRCRRGCSRRGKRDAQCRPLGQAALHVTKCLRIRRTSLRHVITVPQAWLRAQFRFAANNISVRL